MTSNALNVGGFMIANADARVKVVATLIANAAPDAFAGYQTAAEPPSFDLDRDFSVRERERFLDLAAQIVSAMSVALRRGHQVHESCDPAFIA